MTEHPLHILHLTPYYAPAYGYGGVVRAVEGLAAALVQRGHRVTVLTTDAAHPHQPGERLPASEMRDGVHVQRVPNRLPALRRVNLSTPAGLGHAASQLLPQADILHTHEFRTAENGIVLPQAAAHRVPVVLSPHGTLIYDTGRGWMKRGWDLLFSRRLAPLVDHVAALTAQELADARTLWQRLGADVALTTIPNGIDPAEFAALPDPTAFRDRWGLGDDPIVLFLGRLHPRKGAHILAQAFTKLLQASDAPQARLVIAGPDEGLLAALESWEANTGDHITLTGYLDREERLAALAAADLFVLPATGEGLSIAVLEALAAGLPVILSPGCNLPEAAEHGAGLIVPPEPGPLAAALRDLLQDADRRARMGQAARSLVRARFTRDAVAVQYERLYRELLSRRQSR